METTKETRGLVLVLGASGGIGHGIAKSLCDTYEVIGTYYQHADSVADLEQHEHFSSCYLDVTSISSLNVLAEVVQDREVPLIGIVNATGVIDFETGSTADMAVWNQTITTNLTANYQIAQVLLPLVVKTGSFVMLSSTDAQFAAMNTTAYAVSKAGVDSLTKSLALQYGPKQVSVNAVAPGWVETPMMTQTGDELVDYAAQVNPQGRNGTPEDVAYLVQYLLQPETNYLTGQAITLDGGYTNQDVTILREAELQR